MFSDFFLMSLRSLKRRKLRSWLTLLGIFIGIATIVSLISLGEGLEQTVIGQFNVAGADVINVQAAGLTNGPPGSGVVNPLTQKELDAVNRVAEVDFAIGILIKTGFVEINDVSELGFFRGFTGDKRQYELLNLETTEGRLLKSGDTKKVVVGNDYTKTEKFGKAVVIGSNILIEGEQFEVVGIFKKRGSFIIDSIISVPEEELRQLFDVTKDEYSAFGLRIKPGVDMDTAKANIEKVLRKERDVEIGYEDFTVQTSESAIANLKSTLFAVQLFIYIIASISIIVGGLGIMNTMYTSVLERTKDIGIMKAIGAKNRDIFTLFFIESGLLGTFGGLVGLILGVIISKGLAFAGRAALGSNLLSAHITPGLLIGALAFSFVVGTLSGILPAMQASKLNPVDALSD